MRGSGQHTPKILRNLGLCERPSGAEREHDLSIASTRAESASISTPPLSESVSQNHPRLRARPPIRASRYI